MNYLVVLEKGCKVIKIFSSKDCKEVSTLKGHKGAVLAVEYISDMYYLVSTGDDL